MTTATIERPAFTGRQSEVLSWISHYTATRGKMPTRNHVLRAFEFRWINGAASILDQLQEKGVVTWLVRKRKKAVRTNTNRKVRVMSSAISATTIERQPLTDRQRDVLDWISGYIDTHGFSPTVREIGHHYGFTTNGVKTHLNAMRRKGWVSWRDGCSRTLRVIGGDA